jgi:hypothetical protein
VQTLDLEAVVEYAGGIETLAAYLEVDSQVLTTALSAPDSAWTDRVRAMVSENTQKLIGMPSQGGFFWRLTRKRVVKDWLILARWSESPAAAEAADDLHSVITPRPDRPPRTPSGKTYMPWPVMLIILERRYGVSHGEPWSPDAEERFAEDMRSALAGTADPELRRLHDDLNHPEISAAYLLADEHHDRTFGRLMRIAAGLDPAEPHADLDTFG